MAVVTMTILMIEGCGRNVAVVVLRRIRRR